MRATIRRLHFLLLFYKYDVEIYSSMCTIKFNNVTFKIYYGKCMRIEDSSRRNLVGFKIKKIITESFSQVDDKFIVCE